MHELAITESAFQIALAAAEERGARRLSLIRLKVGEMTQVDPACLEFYLAILAQGTIAEGVKVECERVPLRANCRGCGNEYAVTGYRFECPLCRSADAEIESGRELYIDSIEIEE